MNRYHRHMATPAAETTQKRRTDTRAAIVEAAARLMQAEGPDAVTTRAVAAAAGVQAPTIYRLLGDKDGLLDAVAEHVLATYVANKTPGPKTGDPVADLRAGWDMHIGFGLANPALFALMADPRRQGQSPAATAGAHILRARVQRVAEAGRLRVAEGLAFDLFRAASTGAVMTLAAAPAEHRDLSLADAVWDAVIRAIATEVPALPPGDTTAAAVALRTALPALTTLTAAEGTLMAEWLDRIAGR